MCDAAHAFGERPRSGIMTIGMHEGSGLHEKPEILEVYVTSSKRSEVATFMLALLIRDLWNGCRLLTDGDVAIQAVSNTYSRPYSCREEKVYVLIARTRGLGPFPER